MIINMSVDLLLNFNILSTTLRFPMVWDHPLSTYEKFFEKLTFFTS